MTPADFAAGSLYAMVLTDKKALGAVTPIGGVLLIAGSAQLKISVFIKQLIATSAAICRGQYGNPLGSILLDGSRACIKPQKGDWCDTLSALL